MENLSRLCYVKDCQVISTYVSNNIVNYTCFSYTAKQKWYVVRLELLMHFAW